MQLTRHDLPAAKPFSPNATHFGGLRTASIPVFSAQPDAVRFSGLQEHRRPANLQEAKAYLTILNLSLLRERPLDVEDVHWLARLNVLLGQTRDVALTDPADPGKTVILNGRVTVATVNRNPKANLTQLRDTLAAMIAATEYRPVEKDFSAEKSSYRLQIHNPVLAGMMQPAYTADSFARLMGVCKDNGVFHLEMDDKTGLVKTAGIEEAEDDIMSQGWVTDTVRNGVLQRDINPAAYRQALQTLAEFYRNERKAFMEIFADPASYKRPETGVHHMFNPETKQRFPWLASKRLESHGLALKAFCENALETHGQVSDEILMAIGCLSKLFEVIDYPTAPTIGAWEELTFNGLTSDVELMRASFESLKDLLYNPAHEADPGIRALRDKLKQKPYVALLPNEKKLDHLIAIGQKKVEDRVAGKKNPAEHPSRPADAGLAFVTTSTVRLGPTVTEDVRKQLRILDYVNRTVVGDNGVIRYQPFETTVKTPFGRRKVKTFDGYLTPNWGLAADSEGRLTMYKQAFEKQFGYHITHLSPSTPEGFTARASYAPNGEGKEAEWFMIAEIAKGYALQLGKLLDVLETEKRLPTAEEAELIQASLAGATEAVNRSYARITADDPSAFHQFKANGRPAPKWAVPEAFQHVSTLTPGETRMMPGVNTPLAWAASSLYGASQVYLQNLKRLEQLSLLAQ